MRVVLDTNEYISALVFGGLPRAIVESAERGEYELVASVHIRNEVERVLAHKFDWPYDRIDWAAGPLWEIAHFVTPRRLISKSRDETDNRILECAVESGARIVVSGDRDLLVLNPFLGIRIVAAREFAQLLNLTPPPSSSLGGLNPSK